MKKASIGPDEAARLCSVHDLGILDTEPDERFDAITKKATKIFNVPISTITIIDEKREWFKSKQGLNMSEGPRDISFCAQALYQEEIMIIEDTVIDPRFCDNPYVVNYPYIRFYAGKSLYRKKDRQPIGVFCIKDHIPRRMTMEHISTFLDLAEEAENLLNSMDV